MRDPEIHNKPDSKTLVGYTNTVSECAALVKTREPSANGATWGNPKKMEAAGDSKHAQACFAHLNAVGNERKLTQWHGCLFSSM